VDDIRSGIENTLFRFAWAYDMNELDGLAECVTTDAEVEFRDSGLKVGRDAVAAEMRRRRERYDADGTTPWHVISNVYIAHQTDREATVRSRFTFFVHSPAGGHQLAGIGWYDDTFALQDGVWRLKRRRMLPPHDR
jgi:hypothetical protein